MATTTDRRRQTSTTVRTRGVRTGVRLLSEHFPKATARLALAAWFRPRRHEPPTREKFWEMGAVEFRIGRGTAGVRAWSWGSGPLVLLVHGWEGRGLQLGAFVQPLVDAGFRVVTWDAPGHGRSPGNRSSLFSFADTVLAAARQLGPVHGIVAHSMGAAASLLALQTQIPIERIALVSPGDPSRAGKRMAESLGLGQDVVSEIGNQLKSRFGQSMNEVSAVRLAGTLDAATLVVHDPEDAHASFSDAERMAEAAGAEFVAVHDLGHHRILRDADVVAAVTSHIASRTVTVPGPSSCLTEEDLLRDLHHGRT